MFVRPFYLMVSRVTATEGAVYVMILDLKKPIIAFELNSSCSLVQVSSRPSLLPSLYICTYTGDEEKKKTLLPKHLTDT